MGLFNLKSGYKYTQYLQIQNMTSTNMQKSMVHELNGLSNSQFITHRSTFISTAFNEGDFELRKSRIQNLPSYRREDLSGRLNFVVVFQTIEIERLSNEVEALRIALKDSERQNFNVQNYQVQIRELTEKCFAYEREREEYMEEVDKLNMICEKLYAELENLKQVYKDIDPTIKERYRLQLERHEKLEEEFQKLRNRYAAMETSKNREMEDMRLMMQSQRKSMMDREIKELTLRFNSQRQNLEKQIRKFREALDQKQSELQRSNGRISQLEALNQELRRYESRIDEYEARFALISQEMGRLTESLRVKQEEIDRFSISESNLRKKLTDFERKLRDAEEGGEKARILQDQIKDWKIRYSKIEQQNKQYGRQLAKIPQFKQIISQINTESDRLKDAMRQKIAEVDEWKGRHQRIQTEFKQVKSEHDQQLPMIQNKVNQLITQNDRLNGSLKTRATEIQSWRNKYSDMERQLSRLGAVEQEKKGLENQLNNQIRQINQFQTTIRQYEVQFKKYGDIERELDNQRAQRQQTKRQVDRLNNAVRNASEKADNFERKCANLERQLKNFVQIQEQIRVYKQKQINLTKQIDRINGIISQKIREIQALKQTFQKFEGRMSQYQGLQKKLVESVNQTQKLIRDLDESRKQSGALQDKLFQSQSQNKRMKNDVFVLSQEKDQLIRLNNTRTQELEQIKVEYGQLQGQMGQLRQKEARLRQIEEQLRVTEGKLAEIDRRYKNQATKNKQLNNSYEQINVELMKIKRQGMMSPKFKEEFFEIRTQVEQREREFRNINQRIANIENMLRKIKQVVQNQVQVGQRNKQKSGNIQKQFDVCAIAFKKLFDLQNEVYKLNEQNMQLEGKVRIIAVENDSMKKSYNPATTSFEQKSSFSPTKQRKDYTKIDMPLTTKSSTYTNIAVSNVRPVNPSTGFSEINVTESNYAFGFGTPAQSTFYNVNTSTNRPDSFLNLPGATSPRTGASGTTNQQFQFRTSNREF